MRTFVVLGLATLVSTATLESAQFWTLKNPAAWTDAELNRFRTDSPWTGKGTIVSYADAPEKVVVTWHSALVMKEFERRALASNTRLSPVDSAVLAQLSSGFVITATVSGSKLALALRGTLPQSVRLRPARYPEISAVHVETLLLDRAGIAGTPDRRDWDLRQFPRGMDPLCGEAPFAALSDFCDASVTIVATFPRDLKLPRDGDVEFATLGPHPQFGNTGAIRRVFKLDAMRINGAPAL